MPNGKDCYVVIFGIIKCNISTLTKLDIPFPELFWHISHYLAGVWLLLKYFQAGENSLLYPFRRRWVF